MLLLQRWPTSAALYLQTQTGGHTYTHIKVNSCSSCGDRWWLSTEAQLWSLRCEMTWCFWVLSELICWMIFCFFFSSLSQLASVWEWSFAALVLRVGVKLFSTGPRCSHIYFPATSTISLALLSHLNFLCKIELNTDQILFCRDNSLENLHLPAAAGLITCSHGLLSRPMDNTRSIIVWSLHPIWGFKLAHTFFFTSLVFIFTHCICSVNIRHTVQWVYISSS